MHSRLLPLDGMSTQKITPVFFSGLRRGVFLGKVLYMKGLGRGESMASYAGGGAKGLEPPYITWDQLPTMH